MLQIIERKTRLSIIRWNEQIYHQKDWQSVKKAEIHFKAEESEC